MAQYAMAEIENRDVSEEWPWEGGLEGWSVDEDAEARVRKWELKQKRARKRQFDADKHTNKSSKRGGKEARRVKNETIRNLQSSEARQKVKKMQGLKARDKHKKREVHRYDSRWLGHLVDYVRLVREPQRLARLALQFLQRMLGFDICSEINSRL